jgi:GAF domain-containing protein
MVPRVEQHLLALAASVAWDGGDGVVRVLGEVLAAHAPFDAGEVAIVHPTGYLRWTLTDDEEPLADGDLLRYVCDNPQALRLEDLGDLDPFPRSRQALERRGLRSLMVLPLSQAGGTSGAAMVARRYAWAFAGAPLRVLVPVAAMAGLALDCALALTRLHRRQELQPGAREEAANGEAGQLRRRLGEAERSIADLRAALEQRAADAQRLAVERDDLGRQCEELRADLDALTAPPPPGPDSSGR